MSRAETSTSPLTVVIPAAARDDVEDTVDSVRRWLPASRVVVLNDGERDLETLRRDPSVTVLPALAYPRNTLGGLWLKLGDALRWVLEHDEAPLILRLDADALIIRSDLDRAATELARDHPSAGCFGSYRTGPDGQPRDLRPAARNLAAATGVRGLGRPRVRRQLRSYLRAAGGTDYQLGDHALGAALLLRRSMLEGWARRGWLQTRQLARAPVPDDYLFGLLTRASGYDIVDAGGPGGLFALRWRGLPGSPEEIWAGSAYVTHSVRSWEGVHESETRRFFAVTRRGAPPE